MDIVINITKVAAIRAITYLLRKNLKALSPFRLRQRSISLIFRERGSLTLVALMPAGHTRAFGRTVQIFGLANGSSLRVSQESKAFVAVARLVETYRAWVGGIVATVLLNFLPSKNFWELRQNHRNLAVASKSLILLMPRP